MKKDAAELAHEQREHFTKNSEMYSKQLYYHLLKRTCDKTLAEEIRQETMLNFLEYMEKTEWKQEIKNFMAYLIRSARNLRVDLSRRRREEPLMTDDSEEGARIRNILDDRAQRENNPTSRIEDKMTSEREFKSLPLKVILRGLTEYELRLFEMSAVGELSAAEIADEVKVDVNTVRHQLNKIRMKIRYRALQFLKQNGGGDAPLKFKL